MHEPNIFLFGLVICIFVLLVPLFLRYSHGNSTPIGTMSYYHLRMSQTILESHQILKLDPLTLKPYRFEPYHLVLAALGFFFGLEFASTVLPFILGVLSFIFFYAILKSIKISLEQRFIMLLVLLASPIFIYTYTVSNEYACAIFFVLLGLLLFMRKNYLALFFSLASFICASLFGFEHVIIAIVLCLGLALHNKEKLAHFFVILGLLLLFSTYYHGMFYYHFGFQMPQKYSIFEILRYSLSDLGSLTGFSVFALFLTVIGIYSSWREKKTYMPIYILIFILIVFSLYSYHYYLYLNYFISIFAGIGFLVLMNMHWDLDSIKSLTILVLFCGLIFSALSFVIRLSNEEPSQSTKDALVWLSHNSKKNEFVFSHPSRGFWIEYYANLPVFSDELFPLDAIKLNISDKLSYGRKLKETRAILNAYNISYIYIDDVMKQGLVWEREKQGLRFLLRNNDTFERIFENNGIELWKIKDGVQIEIS
jgi:hypothetical protein